MKRKNKLVVMKFGGTSVATPERIKIVARHIKKRKEKGEKIIVVVSAMGKETDRIIEMIKEIRNNPDLREYDQVLHTGEIISAGLLTIALQDVGVPAISLSAFQLGIQTDCNHGGAKIKKIQKKNMLLKIIKEKVVVIPGFQGLAENTCNITTLGRGGSDASAVAIAGAIKADVCEIYTDVDGVYTVDPRLVPNATRFKRINFMQMIAMAAAGAGVLMDRSVDIAQAHNVAIKVLLSPSFGESTGGTIVSAKGQSKDIEESIFLPGISIRKDIGLISITNIPNKPNEAAKIFGKTRDVNIIEAIQGKPNSKASLSILLDEQYLEKTTNKLKESSGIKVGAIRGLVSLSLIDPAMEGSTSYFYRISNTLGNIGVNIKLISSGETSIIIIIGKDDLKKSAQALANEFKLTNT